MESKSGFSPFLLFSFLAIIAITITTLPVAAQYSSSVIKVEYLKAGESQSEMTEIPVVSQTGSANGHILVYRDRSYQVVIHEIDRNYYTEVNGEIESLSGANSCLTLRLIFPEKGEKWIWYTGLDTSTEMKSGLIYTDTVSTRTTIPPDGAFNGKDLSSGGYGDPVGKGTMSFYPLCALSIGSKGKGLGVDLSLPVVYRLSGKIEEGLSAEFDLATSPLTMKFPDRAFFKLARFDFDPEWGMRAALKVYYNIYAEAFKKRVVNEGIWLPFTAMRSIPGWEDFGFAFHETSWGSSDMKDGVKTPNIISDRGSGVSSFQYTEPWDVQIPIRAKNIPYDSVVSDKLLPERHKVYLEASATKDKNGLWQTRRLETPWFRTGWAVSITTNCDPELPGFNRYQFVMDGEVNPAIKMNVDGIYFDSMEWNWHHDLNYNEDHFSFTDFPLTFSYAVGKPAIWHLVSEFEFMKKISDQMHGQGKLAMGNGHGWNPFVASNLDLFGAELSWYSTGDHNITSLDFKRAISFQKPIVFLLNEGLNDKAFTDAPYNGYEVYFEKMMAYGFFPSFFSVDASNDPYWQDKKKIENGRPFFKKYIPLIKEISAAGWEPVTLARTVSGGVRIERFGESGSLFFTVRNNNTSDVICRVVLDLVELGINGRYTASELVTGKEAGVKSNTINVLVPAGRTRVIRVESE
ncbi:MAG TPA: hypothetical protein VMV47_10875 [Bacteroidales bacterium]|nr:hypothetical protein [Bacteroidales bacterium]